jgi:hypothetical protein
MNKDRPGLPHHQQVRAFARRATRRTASEAGDTMIEVVVAALLVALIAAAAFTGFSSVANIAGAQRHQLQANALAQQDEEWLRGLSVTQLSATAPSSPSCGSSAGLYGNECYTRTIDNETYTVTSTAKFVTAASGNTSCTASGTGAADYIETASKVTWANGNDSRPPVIEHSLISPHTGGALIIQATDGSNPTPNPVAGVTIDVTGPGSSTTTQALTTDASGCAVFGGLAGGSYTVSWPGYSTPTGATSASVIVIDGATQTNTYEIQQSGGITANFTTTYSGATGVSGTADTFVAYNDQFASPLVFGTPNSFSTSVSSGLNVFPLSGTDDAYSVFAGACSPGDEPPSPATAVVTAGATTAVTVPEPAMIVDVWSGSNTEVDDAPSSSVVYTGSHWTHGATGNQNYDSTESFDLTAGDYVTFTFTGTSVQWIAPVSNNGGYANVYVDGNLVASNITTYNANTSYQQVIWSTSGLSNGPHTLKLLVLGTKPAASTNTYVQIDAFIYGTQSLVTSAPHVTITDNGCTGNEDVPPTSVPTLARGALTNPGEPYGNFTVCADNGTVKNTATVANTSFTTGNVANIYLATGSPGLASGTCT